MSKKRKTKFSAPMVQRWPLYAWKTPKQVMQINGVNIYGSSIYDISEIPNLSLVIDLSGDSAPGRSLVTGNATAHEELPAGLFSRRVPIIYVNWADGSAHSLTIDWWEILIVTIEELPKGSSVAVCCAGGTGRTGTALAVLAGRTDQLGPGENDPVAWVRAHYYDDAVETAVQRQYVEDITGLCVVSGPSGFHYAPVTYPPGKPVTDTQVVLHPQEAVTGPLGGPGTVEASDHTET